MKKVTVLLVAMFAFAAFAFLPNAAYACGEKAEKTNATKASASACTDKAEKANATQASASTCGAKAEKANATQASGSTCSTKADKANATQASGAGCSASATAASAKLVNGDKNCDPAACMEKYEMVSMNISGMTCGGCEASVTAALQKMDGVVSVKKVCSESGTAIVYVDPAKMKDKSLMTSAVADKGFKAEIIPAVAMTSDVSTVNADGSTCTAAQKAACAASGADKAACAAACAAKKASATAATAKTISAEGTK